MISSHVSVVPANLIPLPGFNGYRKVRSYLVPEGDKNIQEWLLEPLDYPVISNALELGPGCQSC